MVILFLIAEEFYKTAPYNNPISGNAFGIRGLGVSTSMNTVPNYDDIIITKFNAEGELLWGKSIFKRASLPSYNAFIKDDKLHILMNSGKKLKESLDGRLKVSKGLFEATALYDFVYDKDGNLELEKIQDNTKGKTKYIPYKGSYRNGKFVMFNHGINSKRLMILKSK